MPVMDTTSADTPNPTYEAQAPARDASLARGRLEEIREGMIVLAKSGTNYRLHLVVDQPPSVEVGDRIQGRIYANAKRVDVVNTGGRMIEPVIGRPRRLQGRVLAVDPPGGTMTVDCAVPFVCKLLPSQSPNDFEPGHLVSFDIDRGAKFEEKRP